MDEDGRDGPVFGPANRALGVDRLQRFVMGHGSLTGMMLFLVMTVMSVPQADYSDEALAALRGYAQDVREAAEAWARECEELADMWQAQRQELE